jgi:hypothetical protein
MRSGWFTSCQRLRSLAHARQERWYLGRRDPMARLAPVLHGHHNLPTQATGLVGRDREVVDLRQLVLSDHGRLVTLTGVGGCGKTGSLLQSPPVSSARSRTASGWWNLPRWRTHCWSRRRSPRYSACESGQIDCCSTPSRPSWRAVRCCLCWTTASISSRCVPSSPTRFYTAAQACAGWRPAASPSRLRADCGRTSLAGTRAGHPRSAFDRASR